MPGSVPPSPALPDRTAAVPPAVGPLAGRRVLIVEDEDAIRRPLARGLARKGAQVLEAANGLDALKLLDDESLDLIITDLRMPKMSGVELCARLEATRPVLAHRVLVMSGDISQLAQPGAVPLPRDRVLDKPVSLAELERRMLLILASVD